jgi:methyl-accepting chemotaxis protein
MDEKKKYVRKKYFVKQFQIRYALFFVLAIGIGLNIGVALTVLVPLLQTTIPTYPIVYFTLVFTFIILVAVTSILFTHKVAGPIFKIEKIIKETYDNNDLTQRIYLRSGDELHELAEELNLMFDRLRENMLLDFRKIKVITQNIDQLISKIRVSIPPGQTNETLDLLYSIRELLQSVGDKYKL